MKKEEIARTSPKIAVQAVKHARQTELHFSSA